MRFMQGNNLLFGSLQVWAAHIGGFCATSELCEYEYGYGHGHMEYEHTRTHTHIEEEKLHGGN